MTDPIWAYLDLRCLQDANYQRRGVGFHVSSLLRYRARRLRETLRVIALLDAEMAEMPREYRDDVDEIRYNSYVLPRGEPAVFVSCSPMTHDPARYAPFLYKSSNVLSAAIVYDFIPLDASGYLTSPGKSYQYYARLASLKLHDLFLPISGYSARRLTAVLGVSPNRISVTRASVRSVFYEADGAPTVQRSRSQGAPYFLLVGGGDPRKNPEVAIRALQQLNVRRQQPYILMIVGHYPGAYRSTLTALYGDQDAVGVPIEFLEDVEDIELRRLYRNAVATIMPSRIEGFSLPVAEAMACGSPVLASNCAAHRELVRRGDTLFAADDVPQLAGLMSRLVEDDAYRNSIVAEQRGLTHLYHEDRVADAFWTSILNRYQRTLTSKAMPVACSRTRKATVAFLTPYPPDRSGVAIYSQKTAEALAAHAEVDIFTNAASAPGRTGSCRIAAGISVAPLLDRRYRAVISVLGNSALHEPIFDVFETFGGPCILHDSRLAGYYYGRLGEQRFARMASAILRRPVSTAEAVPWLHDEESAPTLFLERIIGKADPLIVHTEDFRAILADRYGVDAHVAPFAPLRDFSDDELTPQARRRARERVGVPADVFMVSTFGFPHSTKGSIDCVLALEHLRSWNIPAQLFFVGDPRFFAEPIRRAALDAGVAEEVHLSSDFLDEARYLDFMLASDAAIQLRMYGLGQPSGALAECISAGLPAVANQSLAEACDAPDYVARVPNHISPLLVAEQLAEMVDADPHPKRRRESRKAYLSSHSFQAYACRLAAVLGLA